MGTELKGRLVDCNLEGPVTAEFASDHVTVRGTWKGEVPFAGLAVERVGESLRISWAGLHASFDAGPLAERLAARIANPPTVLDKLGITAGTRVVAVAVPNDLLEQVRALVPKVRTALAGPQVDVVLFGATSVDNLRRMGEAWRAVGDPGCLWVVYPKGKDELKERDVRLAGPMLGLVDTQVARISETHTAMRFNRRRT